MYFLNGLDLKIRILLIEYIFDIDLLDVFRGVYKLLVSSDCLKDIFERILSMDVCFAW